MLPLHHILLVVLMLIADNGIAVAIDRQVSIGAKNHPAMLLQINCSTDGTLQVGLPVKIDTTIIGSCLIQIKAAIMSSRR